MTTTQLIDRQCLLSGSGGSCIDRCYHSGKP